MCLLSLFDLCHQAWCDGELHKNKNKRDSKSQQIEKLAAEVAQLEAHIADLTEQLATLTSNFEAKAKTAADGTAVRKEQSSVEAVQSAIKVLQDFFNADVSLLQGQRLTKYVPQTNSKRGIIDLLEVIEADFARVLSETKAEEAQQASEYARVMADLKTVMERMDKVVHDTGLAKDQKEYIRDNTQAQRVIPGGYPSQIFTLWMDVFRRFRACHTQAVILMFDGVLPLFLFFNKADLQTTQSAMDAASKYSDTLKPICVQVQVTFEDRDRLRKEEIEAPQEAHSLLDQPKNVSWKQRNEELTSDMENSFCKMQTVKVSRSDAVVCRGLV